MSTLSVGLDVTPLFDHPTGVTRFVTGLLSGLRSHESVRVGGWIVSVRPIDKSLPAAADAPEFTARIHTPARLVHRAWGNGSHFGSRRLGRFDVVHGTNFTAPPGPRSVISLHDLTLFDSTGRGARRSGADVGRAEVVLRAVAEGSHLVVPTEYVRRSAIETLHADPGRVTSVTYGLTPIVSSAPGAGRKRVDLDRYVLALGTVSHRKNLVQLIRAMDHLPGDVGLVVAGAVGDDESAVREAISVAEQHRSVRRLTDVDDTTRADLLTDASLLAYPSLDEGFGFPPLEAMSVGVPVVAADAGSIPEVVGDAALLVDPSDPSSIAQAMLKAITPGGAAELVAKGYSAAARFDWAVTASEMIEVYKRVASQD